LFSICSHYAANVTYTAEHFVSKNKAKVDQALSKLMAESPKEPLKLQVVGHCRWNCVHSPTTAVRAEGSRVKGPIRGQGVQEATERFVPRAFEQREAFHPLRQAKHTKITRQVRREAGVRANGCCRNHERSGSTQARFGHCCAQKVVQLFVIVVLYYRVPTADAI